MIVHMPLGGRAYLARDLAKSPTAYLVCFNDPTSDRPPADAVVIANDPDHAAFHAVEVFTCAYWMDSAYGERDEPYAPDNTVAMLARYPLLIGAQILKMTVWEVFGCSRVPLEHLRDVFAMPATPAPPYPELSRS